ncbi:MAG TPA: Holliday junction resolvase RuvX [Candidatus Aquicultoraceae bacterium]|nr:Holliday junction resolvase RuvX [Candidatus Aquicultoraceae bacterium]
MEKRNGRILGLDYGSRRIGAAISDPLGIIAQPLSAIRRRGNEKDVDAVGGLVREYAVDAVLIGLPLTLGGEEGDQAKKARLFGDRIRDRLKIPVETWDERMTTVQAERHLIASGVRREKRKEIRDSLSAMFLLQSALDYRNRK